jgi:hypothetical protein
MQGAERRFVSTWLGRPCVLIGHLDIHTALRRSISEVRNAMDAGNRLNLY